MLSKKEIVARISGYSGATRALEALTGPPSLLILNYHRIGDANRTPYDSGTFSCTSAEFDWQVRQLKRRYEIVDLEQAVDIIHGRAAPAKPSILLTFDDGYRDNFEQAFPILRRQQVSATFFVPTAFAGTGTLPWWDIIAYIAKTSRQDHITLDYPESTNFDLTPDHQQRSIQNILKLFKRPSVADTERFISELEIACASERPSSTAERCFLNWDEAREMLESGMCFGSHTHTHEILSKLPYAQQVEELATSRQILEHELGKQVATLAYPVGQQTSFSEDTKRALQQTHYHTAFSFYSGVNHPAQIEPFDVVRCGIDSESQPMFRLRLALRAASGKDLL